MQVGGKEGRGFHTTCSHLVEAQQEVEQGLDRSRRHGLGDRVGDDSVKQSEK